MEERYDDDLVRQVFSEWFPLVEIPDSHPRKASLEIRERVIEGMLKAVVAPAGLIAHGRGEAFDYLLGEKTPDVAQFQEKVGVAWLLLAQHPVISVNGNVAALCPRELVTFSKIINAPLEVNLFYRTKKRMEAVMAALEKAGATEVLGVDPEYHEVLGGIDHPRRIVDRRGIYKADVVFVPLEDGDRTQALRQQGKDVVAVDLNPLSRTARWSSVCIVNNIIRALPEMIELAKAMKRLSKKELRAIVASYNHDLSLKESLFTIAQTIEDLAKKPLACRPWNVDKSKNE